ncbi:MAG TPA: hypothetical protein VIV11_17545 [Kofleriaceae bacterium]
MLSDERVHVVPTWAREDNCNDKNGVSNDHREVDQRLRAIAKQKSVLDADELRWLREAERLRVWRTLGFATALEYLEDVFGYGPRVTKDRLRVAKELGELPGLEAELRNGALPWSAARELSRVMTRATEAHWLARARGRNVHDIQELVSGHKKGDLPDDPKDPALLTRRFVFELDARRQGLFEQVRAVCERERGEHVEDVDLFEAMCMSFLAGGGVAADTLTDEVIGAPADEVEHASPGGAGHDKAPRPAHQIVYLKCESCSAAMYEARGRRIQLRDEDIEHAECDAEIVREADIAAAQVSGKRRSKPTLTIPAKTRDLVWRRDHGRCRFPGCRATRHLAIHHLVHREHGGSHDETNLLVLCDGHHKLLHAGIVTISGCPSDELVFVRNGERIVDARSPAVVAANRQLRESVPMHAKAKHGFADVVKIEQTKQALIQLGYKARAARRAIEAVCAHVGTDADIATIVKAVLDADRNGARLGDSERDGAERRSTEAIQALVGLGFSKRVAAAAVRDVSDRIDAAADLSVVIKEALRLCG